MSEANKSDITRLWYPPTAAIPFAEDSLPHDELNVIRIDHFKKQTLDIGRSKSIFLPSHSTLEISAQSLIGDAFNISKPVPTTNIESAAKNEADKYKKLIELIIHGSFYPNDTSVWCAVKPRNQGQEYGQGTNYGLSNNLLPSQVVGVGISRERKKNLATKLRRFSTTSYDGVDVLGIAVRDGERDRGIGKLLLHRMAAELPDESDVCLRVPVTDFNTQNRLRFNGFVSRGVRQESSVTPGAEDLSFAYGNASELRHMLETDMPWLGRAVQLDRYVGMLT